METDRQMMPLSVGVRWLRPDRPREGRLPFYATDGAAGLDLMAVLDEPLVIRPFERVRVPTGIALDIPRPDVVALIFPRSGQAYHRGLTMANAVGVIDSDYMGEIQVLMTNINPEEAVVVEDGERIAQLLFMPVYRAALFWTEARKETARGEGGFGSTGFRTDERR
ncbi:dUTP diphosphatase [Hydrogenibacillus sp. N12]|uniref:dUTP diphosphatase n=1 Tax=Hydrogenibacillus sp. N12 TaxID=2866627 RepID=UPI00207C003F|nr:dUTP diphosphatase [Hydrogenibacillus sp. N12]